MIGDKNNVNNNDAKNYTKGCSYVGISDKVSCCVLKLNDNTFIAQNKHVITDLSICFAIYVCWKDN